MANRRFIDFPIAASVGNNDIVLIWQDGLNKQTTKATLLQGSPQSLAGLTDVDISALNNGQILQYNSTTSKWENVDRTDINLSELGDVTIVSPANGQVLVYNSSTGKWENSSGGYVPYTGAVTTVDLGAQGLLAGYIGLDTSVAGVPNDQGIIYWDDSRSTAALIMNGTLQHIGQDTFFYVKNSTGSSIAKGTAVRFDGTDGASGHLKIAPFLANGTYPSNYFMGVTAEAIANGSFGQVMHFGELTGVNTSGYTAGALLYASTSVAGAFQTTAPVAPNNIVLVAAAINSTNNGTILVRPTYGSNINQDEGVKITSGTTGDLLQLQAGGLWENKTLAQVIGSAYVPSTRTITINETTQDLSANRTYNVGTVTAVTASSPLFSSGGTTPNITIQQASGSQSGFLSSTDWTTFNNKQNALTNPVTGTGTTNYLPKFTGSTTIGNSQVFDNGTNVGIGTGSTGGGRLNILNIASNPVLSIRSQNNVYEILTMTFDESTDLFSITNKQAYSLSGIAFGTNNTERVRIAQSGNLLVGTTTDAGYKLDVNGTGRFSGDLGIGIAPSQQLTIGGQASAQMTLRSSTTTGSSEIYFGDSAAVYRGYIGYQHDGDYFQFATAASVKLTIASTGAATFSSSVTAGGALTVSYANARASVNSTTTTNSAYMSFSNSVTGYVGLDNSAGTDFGNGAYSMNIFNGGAYNLNLGTSNVTRLTITSGGNVGIGTSSPSGKLHLSSTGDTYLVMTGGASPFTMSFLVDASALRIFQGVGTTERMRITSGGEVLVGGNTDNGAYNLQCNGTGVWGAGAYVNGSDRNIKDNISTIEKGLEYIEKMNPVRFKYKPNYTRDHTMQTGFIAQELQEVFANEDYLSGLVQNGVHLSVAYQNLLPILVKAIQEQQLIINDLKQKIS